MDIERFAMHFAAGALVLVVCFGMFAAGWIGGGDAKLAAVTALWFGFDQLMPYLGLAGIFGGVLTFAILTLRSSPLPEFAGWPWLRRLHSAKEGVPYGIALAFSALLVLPETCCGGPPFWADDGLDHVLKSTASRRSCHKKIRVLNHKLTIPAARSSPDANRFGRGSVAMSSRPHHHPRRRPGGWPQRRAADAALAREAGRGHDSRSRRRPCRSWSLLRPFRSATRSQRAICAGSTGRSPASPPA